MPTPSVRTPAPSRGRSKARENDSRTSSLTADEHRRLMWIRIAWFASAMLWVFITLSLATYSPGDAPAPNVSPHNSPAHNLCGMVGAVVSHYILSGLGWGAWVLVGLAALAMVVVGAGRMIEHLPVRIIGALLLAATVSVLQALFFPSTGPVQSLPGGVLGTVSENFLSTRFGGVGTVIWSLLAIAVGATVTLDVWAWIVAAWTGRVLFASAKVGSRVALAGAQVVRNRFPQGQLAGAGMPGTWGATGRVRPDDVSDDDTLTTLSPGELKSKSKKSKPQAAIDDTAGGLGATESFDPDGSSLPAAHATADFDEDDEDADEEADETDQDADDEGEGEAEADSSVPTAKSSAPAAFDPEALRAKMAKLPVRFAATTTRSATDQDLAEVQNQNPEQNLEGYKFPGLDLLEEPEVNFSATMEKYVREQAESLERALREYKIEGEVVGVESGPVITLYELRLAPGTKVAALSAISSDLARSMKAINIRIVPNMAGRDTVGVEVPNAQKEKVRLKELMTKAEVYADMRLPMFLGKDASGESLICDLASMPHMLIAGTTGSGKSVCMNSILMSFLYTKKPNELKLVLVDPKMVELSQFKDIPHLMCPVVTEMSKAAAILEWAVNKMDERYELLAEAGCRDIHAYNDLSWEDLKERLNITTPEEEVKIPRKLPFMVFVIDELADLMMTTKEVEHSIVRIAQKARAVGMHLILATQRPQANVVTGLIKSNMPARVAFKVASAMDSRIVLDQKGGELLLGQGDMLYLSPRSSKLTRAQGTLVDDREIRRVVKFLRDVAAPSFERQLMQIRTSTSAPDAGPGTGLDGDGERNGWLNAQEDPLFDSAVEIVLETRRGSVSMLQRRLAIGYTRAARLIELMGEAGILGEHKGTVAREIAMTIEEWRAMKAQAQADADAAEKGGQPSKPIAPTIEQAQSIVNNGNLKEQLEEESAAKATEELDDADDETAESDDIDDGGENADEDESEDAETPPFDVVTRVNRNPNESRK